MPAMESDSDKESMEGDVEFDTREQGADWGKAKYDYYYTDYIDKDYPSKLSAKEEKEAALEQEEALRIQRKLLSTLDNIDVERIIDQDDDRGELISFLERQNKELAERVSAQAKSRKRVKFDEAQDSAGEESRDDDIDDEEDGDDDDGDEDDGAEEREEGDRKRRPINMAMKKNRGLTPYKKREFRNPRVKHKLKYKKAMSKRRRNVQEARTEQRRYAGEASGIKTSTIKSIRLC